MFVVDNETDLGLVGIRLNIRINLKKIGVSSNYCLHFCERDD